MQKVKLSIRKHPDETERDLMLATITRAEQKLCVTCGGFGHVSKGCATKTNVDKAVKAIGLQGLWGQVKSELKMDQCETVHKTAMELREGHKAENVTPIGSTQANTTPSNTTAHMTQQPLKPDPFFQKMNQEPQGHK